MFGFNIYGVALSSPILQDKPPTIDTTNRKPESDAPKDRPTESFWDRTTNDPLDLYTLFLAIFTAALVGVSTFQIYFLNRADKTARTAAEAAKLSADAAIGVELPKLFVTNIDFQLASLNLTDPVSSLHQISITITNYGRTPAFLHRESAEFFSGPSPAAPIYPNAIDLEPGTIIEKGQLRTLIARSRDNLSQFDVRPFVAGQAMLRVYGAIWFRDFLNKPHVMRFCADLHVPQGLAAEHPPKFIQGGPTAYTESY
jgi:hypothetical protein